MILTPSRLVEYGLTLYGDDWEGTLADRVKVSKRTVIRWRDEECAMPSGLHLILEALVEQKIAALNKWLARSRGQVGETHSKGDLRCASNN